MSSELLALCAAFGLSGSNCVIEDPRDDAPIRAVIEAAEEYEVPLDLAIATAMQESRFNCGAVSRADAHGVMQVTTATAKWMRRDPSRLHECSYGARVGMEFLKLQLTDCNDDYQCALEQYNCGKYCANRNNEQTAKYKCAIGMLVGVKCRGSF